MSALLDAAALAEDHVGHWPVAGYLGARGVAALRLLASHARESATQAKELDALGVKARAERAEAQAGALAELGGRYRSALLEHGGQAGLRACIDIDAIISAIGIDSSIGEQIIEEDPR